ncbi:hypothetical protein GALMADRAFT_225763 [Galerina marginata CBS 339.88]|uniref:Ubiquinone biosynthesis protein n=1 Tax=Galerina marginata (strain CBS 339.88) TaxID=685588 RepID=A0A067TAM2_GALM3|nr:hypothetical protein GALMADRAFT_225763 [Galerina marginata CBS 339.88]
MSTTSSARLLKLALPLVRTHGFTREALSRSVLALPPGEVHAEPLSDTTVSALFGHGDLARRTLIDAWLKDGLRHMALVPGVERPMEPPVNFDANTSAAAGSVKKATVRDVLRARLEYNEPVLPYLPEAFALLASPASGIPPLDPTQVIKHAAYVADEACHVTGDQALQLDWYTRRAAIAAVYAASELHQLASPQTAYSFLDSLLDTSSTLKSSFDEVSLYSSYIFKSWRGIIKSSGIFL